MLLHGRSAAAQRASAAAQPADAPHPAREPRSMMSRNGLRRVCAIAAAALIPAVAGCEAGANAPVLQWHPPTGGASASIPASGAPGFIAIRNVFVLGAPPASTLPAGSSAGVFLALVNTGPKDRLVSISAPGTATSVRLPKGGVTVAEDQIALLTGPVPTVILDGLTHSLPGGTDVQMVLTFQNAGSVTLAVPIMPKAQYYATFSPAPASPTPSASGKHAHRGKASATATPSATGTAPATPTATATPTASATP
jgi:copper(I)-binding protein